MYLQVSINFKENNLTKILPIARFIYNNAKNTSTKFIYFKLNYKYLSSILFKKITIFALGLNQQTNYSINYKT